MVIFLYNQYIFALDPSNSVIVVLYYQFFTAGKIWSVHGAASMCYSRLVALKIWLIDWSVHLFICGIIFYLQNLQGY